MSLLTICDFTVLANYEAIEPMCIDWYNIGAMHRNNRVQFVDQLVILHSINKGSQLASSVHQFTQHNTPNVYRPLCLDCASAQAVCPFYCSPSAFMFGSYISPCGASVLLYYISPYILIANFYYIGPYSPSVWTHTYSLQFLLQSAEIHWLNVIGHLYMSGLTVLSVGYD